MKAKKIMVFGTFDLLHPGHISFLRQAKNLGNFLIVSVARDKNVKRAKGYFPVLKEKRRVEIVKFQKIASKVILAELKDPWNQIKKFKPDIIALGYDQKPYVAKNEKAFLLELKKRGIKTKIVRLKPFRPDIFKSKIMRRRGIRNLRISNLE